MTELKAKREGLEIVLRFDNPDDIAPDLRAAIDELVEAMAAETGAGAEVSGFGLNIGLGAKGFVPLDPTKPAGGKYGPRAPLAGSCWGYDMDDGMCGWYDGDVGDVTTCGIFTV